MLTLDTLAAALGTLNVASGLQLQWDERGRQRPTTKPPAGDHPILWLFLAGQLMKMARGLLRSALWSGVAVICMRDLTGGLPHWFTLGLVLFWVALVLMTVVSGVVVPVLLRDKSPLPVRLTLQLPPLMALPLMAGPLLGWMAVGTFWLWLTLQLWRR